jgi:hypothetical protein
LIPVEAAQYPIALLMPTLAHGLFLLILYFTPQKRPQNALISLGLAGGVPVFFYLFFMVLQPLWQPLERNYGIHVFLVIGIVGTVIFGFFLGRGLYILATRNANQSLWLQIPLQIMIAVAFPLLGLALNHGSLLPNKGNFEGFFGDFSHPFFWQIALINGILVMLPNFPIPSYRLILFVGRSIGFTFVLYFFLVFLPFLPLSIVAILALGLGFLMLTPLALTILQSQTLVEDFHFLQFHFPKSAIISSFLLGLAVLPGVIVYSFQQDRYALDQALAYVYAPQLVNESTPKSINTKRLGHLLHHIEVHKKRGDFFSANNTPYLSFLYNAMVMNNLTLSQSKINRLRYLFLDVAPQISTSWEARLDFRTDSVLISKINTRTHFNPQLGYWSTWVDLEISNKGTDLGEYADQISLPAGVFVDDYYLDINGKRQSGVLAEKKAATWIYQQISTLTRQDPGILQYTGSQELSLRIFPFQSCETRYTGFSVVHAEPLNIAIGKKIIRLGDAQQAGGVSARPSMIGGSTYVSAEAKKTLPQLSKKVRYSFILDGSKKAIESKKKLQKMVDQWQRRANIAPKQVEFMAAGAYPQQFNSAIDWKKQLEEYPNNGGFFVERAIQKKMTAAVMNPRPEQLVFVLVSDREYIPFEIKDIEPLAGLIPQGVEVLQLHSSGVLTQKWSTNQRSDADSSTSNFILLAWPNAEAPSAYLLADGLPSLIFSPKGLEKSLDWSPKSNDPQANIWSNGIQLQSQWAHAIIHPEGGDAAWRKLTLNSFAAHILTPTTSFLALETESQRRMLLKKQWESFHANKALDLGEEPEPMSEPDWIWVLLLVFVWWRFDRNKRLKLAA